MTGLKSLAVATAAIALGGAVAMGGASMASTLAGPSAARTVADGRAAPTTSSTLTVDEQDRGHIRSRTTDRDASQPKGSSEADHEVLRGSETEGRADGPDGELGRVDPAGGVPSGLDLAAFPGAPAADSAHPPTGSGSLSAGPWCRYQCISSGIAYARGLGAELVVETRVEADIFISVVTDDDGDGEFDLVGAEYSPSDVTRHTWALDHLDPGQTYHVMVAATDEHEDTSHAWGQFTTLSTRTVEISIDEVDVVGGPGNVVDTDTFLRVDDDDHVAYDLGTWADLGELDRHVDVDLMVSRRWDSDVCEPFWPALMASPQGDSDDSCVSWNTAAVEVDLDVVHPSKSRWSSVTFTRTLATPVGGPYLPPGYGDPRYFNAGAVATFHVVYSA